MTTAFDANAQADELTRPVLVRLNDDGSYSARSVTSSPDFKLRALCEIPSRLVVPVIFVPGVMGTRLRVKGKPNSPAWFPPEGTWEKLVAALSNLGRDAARRQALLDPDATEVDDNGPARPSRDSAVLLGDAKGDTDAERGKWRGWGQLHKDSYGEILDTLEQRLARMLVNGSNTEPHWLAAVMRWQDAQRLGAQKPFAALDDAALELAASVFYPVHAVGYNWLRSNKESAEHLAREIERILGYYASRRNVAEKVLIVTHSMGGLVARACAQLPGMQERILGVVHGAMPAIGAPATYKRMRAGFEGMEQVVLGRNAAECTAVVANAPGPLELLPTRQYQTRLPNGGYRHWLRVSHQGLDKHWQPGEVNTLLGADDPYADIYLNNSADAWWRMVKEDLIDPAGREEREKAAKEGEKEVIGENAKQSDFAKFAEIMKVAKTLHNFIEDKYHPVTYAFYAADAKRPSWNEVHWKRTQGINDGYIRAALVDDDLNGAVTVQAAKGTHVFEIDKARAPGDGTVPEESGAAPTPHVLQMFRHEGKAKGHTSYDHQHAYSADIVQATTLYSIVRIVADSDWLRTNLCRA